MPITLHPYQRAAVEKIKENPYHGLFLDMGMGKTLIALTAFAEMQILGLSKRALVITTKRVAQNVWPQEVKKWKHTRHLRLAVAVGNRAQRNAALADTEADITVANFDTLGTLFDYFRIEGRPLPWDMLIIDESSAFKNQSSIRFKTLRRQLNSFSRRIILTGTPAPKNLMDLWAQIFILDLGESLGSVFTKFRACYFYPSQSAYGSARSYYTNWELRPGAEEKIKAAIEPLTVSLKANDYLKLPKKIENTVRLEMPAALKKRYKTFARTKVDELTQGTITAANAAVLTGKLLQFSSGAVYHNDSKEYEVVHDIKIKALAELVEQLSGRPLIVFYLFNHERVRLQQVFPEAIGLDTPGAESKWNNGQAPILLLQPQSAAHGLNLQFGGSMVCWFSLPWSLDLFSQGNARVYRQGQKHAVVIQYLSLASTIDEKIASVLSGRSAVQESLMDHLRLDIKQIDI